MLRFIRYIRPEPLDSQFQEEIRCNTGLFPRAGLSRAMIRMN